MEASRSIALCLLLAACKGGDGNDGGSETGGTGGGSASSGDEPTTGDPVCTDCTPVGMMSFRLPSPAGATLWTATTMDKVLREAAPPEATAPAIQIHAARNEYEPFQLVVRSDTDAMVSVSVSDFSGPGPLPAVTLHRVDYVNIAAPSDPGAILSGQIPDPLVPIAFGTPVAVSAASNQPLWFTAQVPADALAGDYNATITVTIAGLAHEVPVQLHVFNFAIPAQLGFDGNWNTSFEALGGGASLERVELLKDFFFAHRLVPSSVAWPAGTNYNGGIIYDCAAGVFKEEVNDYDISSLGPKYIDGVGWNGVGFPSFQAMTFVDNSTPRPQLFCDVDRGPDHVGTAEYNAAWSKMLTALDAYLVGKGWAGKAYYYTQNEPQGPADYDTAAYLATLTRSAAPNLRLAISEEPKPEIAEHPQIAGNHYDLWWANLSAFEPVYAATRQALGEQVWWYFLYGDLPPHFNPITIDHAGIETRVAHWAAWKFRIRGFAYYSVTGWGADPIVDPRPQGTNQNGDGFLLYPPSGRRARHQHPLGAAARGHRGPRVPPPRRRRQLSRDPGRGRRLRRLGRQRRLLDHRLHPRRLGPAAPARRARLLPRGCAQRLSAAHDERPRRAQAGPVLPELSGPRRRARHGPAAGRRPDLAEGRLGPLRRRTGLRLVGPLHRRSRDHEGPVPR
ncbi:MAG: DUF4091 domain-containing protein [Nannocystis sp.]|uniref:glycoside hydrolase domain-containing protein n=1 Tax=Nannocystis sp. TaxID=1962667 RepID=UPI002427EEE4|nr:glycoside hydrolase domain-containing protein [Nannocystis sp.]MBK9753780.1 DUF4091 domain-containing protein [Nannocystis sp.]